MVSTCTGWQPIETAPKDGTKIDLWADGGRLVDARWRSISEMHEDDPETYAWYWPEIETEGEYARWVEVQIGIAPTHWKPITIPADVGAAHE